MSRSINKSGNAGRPRNTSPSPLLLSPRDMERAISKERMRCDRYSQFFALIVIKINKTAEVSSVSQIRMLAKLLHKRLRLTDEKGLLLKGGLGVLLPMTDLAGAKNVLGWLLKAADENGLAIEADVFTYSGKSTSTSSRDTDFENESANDSECRSQAVGHQLLQSMDGSLKTVVSTETKTFGFVRADSESQIRGSHLNHFSSMSSVSTTHFCPRYPHWKRLSDIAGAMVGLTIGAPLIAVAAIAIKCTSKGPVFFKQMRTGQYGRPFPIYKLRTMVVDAEEQKSKLHELNERDGPAFKMKNDPRVTDVGRFLRNTGLDELPQLWNVMRGDMAIVGPRPLPCNEDAKCMVWQRRRLDTKPGLTCIWQISKGRNVSFEEWMRMDLRYSSKRTIVSDCSLIVKTIMAVFLGRVGH